MNCTFHSAGDVLFILVKPAQPKYTTHLLQGDFLCSQNQGYIAAGFCLCFSICKSILPPDAAYYMIMKDIFKLCNLIIFSYTDSGQNKDHT